MVARLPLIAFVGRPNVGKSTLFNQFAKNKKSIVNEEPGATRDRLYTEAVVDEAAYQLIDTGGIDLSITEGVLGAIRQQSFVAIEEADIIVFMVDAETGPVTMDEEVAHILRRAQKPVIVAVNKAESFKNKGAASEFYSLGFKDVFPISGAHKQGLGDLFERIFELLPEALRFHSREVAKALEEGPKKVADTQEKGAPLYKVAVIGKPNAGKSSFVNKLLGEERHLTSDIPGTTVDAVDSYFEHGNRAFILIDTAGIRRKRSIGRDLEKQAVSRALTAMDKADIALLLIDAISGVTEQDLKVASFAHDKGKALIIIVNKWDLAKKEHLDAEIYSKQIRARMPFVAYAPIRFVSAITGSRVFDVLDTITEVADAYYKRIPTSKVNALLTKVTEEHQLAVVKGRRVKLYFGSQVAVAPPTFVFSSNDPERVHFSYQRYLQNCIRETFGFKGTPLRLIFKHRNKEEAEDNSKKR